MAVAMPTATFGGVACRSPTRAIVLDATGLEIDGEQGVYLAVAVLLVLALALALLGAGALLWNGLTEFTATEPVYRIIDRLLFVLMMVEILHTVHASIRTGTLLCEPFLIVGLIACIRRVLVITLETSQLNQPEKWDPAKMALFQSNMIELGVLAGLITVLVASIRLTRPGDKAVI